MENIILKILEKRKKGINAGIPSFCSANKIVIEAVLEEANRTDDYALIEATSNQVNQFGGYMNMKSEDFKQYVYQIADKINFDKTKIILGGDHLGPLPWVDLDEDLAMGNAQTLVKECVLAGYTKIHLDTSMKLANDSKEEKLKETTIAKRGAILFKTAEDAYQLLQKTNESAIHPVYVIGSEVPIPGGIQEDEELKVTDPKDFERTILAYKEVFHEMNLDYAWKYIIGIVVQPGVEFGADQIKVYNREKAQKLCNTLKKYPDIVFEGHSTDYQPSLTLREMVEDGIAILKVGPALTNAVREGLYALSYIEKRIIKESDQSHFIDVLEAEMLSDNSNWVKHYLGNQETQKIMRQFSFSDRSRYYISHPNVAKSIDKLLSNLSQKDIPLSLIHQFLPIQAKKIISGELSKNPVNIIKDCVVVIIKDYNQAVSKNYLNI